LSSMVLEHKESSVVRNCWDEFLWNILFYILVK
jgi:hypothetical protein